MHGFTGQHFGSGALGTSASVKINAQPGAGCTQLLAHITIVANQSDPGEPNKERTVEQYTEARHQGVASGAHARLSAQVKRSRRQRSPLTKIASTLGPPTCCTLLFDRTR